jgi:chloramphenicol 3-O phosphotransferase
VSLPQIVWLNGTTSAGKTTLARGLQAALPGAWVRLGIDEALGWMGPGWADRPEGFQVAPQPDGTAPIRLGEEGLAHARLWRAMARTALDAGYPLVIDDVMFDLRLRDLWLETLHGLDVAVVGVRCPLAQAERREAERGDRVRGQARAQQPVAHAAMVYDVEVDTGLMSPARCVEVAALGVRMPRVAFRTMAARRASP